jgi:hypothetical protein
VAAIYRRKPSSQARFARQWWGLAVGYLIGVLVYVSIEWALFRAASFWSALIQGLFVMAFSLGGLLWMARRSSFMTPVTYLNESSELNRRGHTTDELSELRHAIHDDAPMLAVAEFSPGPWWGFNGIQSLILTADQLYVVPQGIALTHRRLRRSLPRAAIHTVTWRTGQRFGLNVVQMSLSIGSRRRRYTSIYQEGADLAAKLAPQTPPA